MQTQLLIEACVVENVAVSWSVKERNTLLYVWGADSVQSQLDGVYRNKTVYQRVTSMLSHDHNWALLMNPLVVQTQFRMRWIEV